MMRKHAKNLLIPHKGNNYKPHALQKFSVLVMGLMLFVTFAMANLQALLWMSSDWMVSTILPAVIVDLTNENRADEVLTPLVRNPILDIAAQMKADDMAKNEYFAHYSPAGVSPWFWFDKAEYSFIHAGENLAVHFTDSGELVDAWMASPGHRQNILNSNYREIGIGTAKGEYNGFPTVYVVQLFGAPALAQEVPQVVPPATTLVANAPISVIDDTVTLEVVSEPNQNEFTTENIAVASIVSAGFEEEVLDDMAVVPTELEDFVVTEVGSFVAYSDFATTSRTGIPAPIAQADDGTGGTTGMLRETNTLERVATQPQVWLEVVYLLLGAFVVLALLLSIMIEWRRQHPAQIAYGTGLLATMSFLFYIHTLLTAGVTII